MRASDTHHVHELLALCQAAPPLPPGTHPPILRCALCQLLPLAAALCNARSLCLLLLRREMLLRGEEWGFSNPNDQSERRV